MTNNEAAKWIQLYIDLAKIDPTTGEAAYLNDDNKKTIEAMEMAINALKMEACADKSSLAKSDANDEEITEDDQISRRAAIEAIDDMVEPQESEDKE